MTENHGYESEKSRFAGEQPGVTGQYLPPSVSSGYAGVNGAHPNMGGAHPNMGVGFGQPQQSDKSAIVAALLQFFLGGLGIGNFYTGKTVRGFIQLIISLLALPLDLLLIGFALHALVGLWAFVEVILYLLKSGSYGYDSQGRPLR